MLNHKNKAKNDQDKILDKLGKDLVDVIKNIPKGILIMFPSYKLMRECFKK